MHANGPTTTNYFKNNFGLSARESIALTLGAHSFGKFNYEVSMFKYFWTRSQQQMMNNQMFKHVAARPQYFLNCGKDENGHANFALVGDAWGQKANISWQTSAHQTSKSGGPYQWFHKYDRCPASNDCAAINTNKIIKNPSLRAEPPTPEGCCDDLEPGKSQKMGIE